MQHGFKRVVVDLIRKHPGLAAEEYAKMALDQGLAGSDSPKPIFSLATTLMKEEREGRLREVVAKKVNGKLHYFPALHAPPLDLKSPQPNIRDPKAPSSAEFGPVQMTILIPSDILNDLDLLVEFGKARNRCEALLELVRSGMVAQNGWFSHTREMSQKIKQMKESVPPLKT